MTEQEAEAMIARLGRIWKPHREFKVKRVQFRLFFEAPLEEGIRVEYSIYYPTQLKPEPSSCYWLTEGEEHHSFMSCYVPLETNARSEINLNFDENTGDPKQYLALQDHWLPYFRRNCWLSGCPIEASAHEKMEWMQGFTREEIDAWNLKLLLQES